ncbi:protein ALP1-like [Panicum hallii]|uniref:protein ALP1-like n=1 Tax=Panicum hallii TaxID=206008 RepID=UPI000DF4E13E|nr:protein ALP1-like [Panicum hallii]
MWSHFKDCIGVIDGTHITATPWKRDLIRYIGRSGKPTHNVMGVVDFDMRFTYASIGQPGSMHDTTVLYHALESDEDTFPHPPLGKYYVVDAGYPNRDGYLAPYKCQRYHVPEWRNSAAPNGEQERFNYLHSSLRNVVERTFGVWKMKWRILLKMPTYPLDKQMMIVAATICLHNYIRENYALDEDFQKCDRDPDYVPTIPT